MLSNSFRLFGVMVITSLTATSTSTQGLERSFQLRAFASFRKIFHYQPTRPLIRFRWFLKVIYFSIASYPAEPELHRICLVWPASQSLIEVGNYHRIVRAHYPQIVRIGSNPGNVRLAEELRNFDMKSVALWTR